MKYRQASIWFSGGAADLGEEATNPGIDAFAEDAENSDPSVMPFSQDNLPKLSRGSMTMKSGVPAGTTDVACPGANTCNMSELVPGGTAMMVSVLEVDVARPVQPSRLHEFKFALHATVVEHNVLLHPPGVLLQNRLLLFSYVGPVVIVALLQHDPFVYSCGRQLPQE